MEPNTGEERGTWRYGKFQMRDGIGLVESEERPSLA